jgi:hypothetical protein
VPDTERLQELSGVRYRGSFGEAAADNRRFTCAACLVRSFDCSHTPERNPAWLVHNLD